MELRWDAVVIDCRDPQALARFWSALLRLDVRGSWKQYVGLQPAKPGQPRLILQRTDDPRPVKNTIHLDLHVPSAAELTAAVDRAIVLGAHLVEEHNEETVTWCTLADPEGNLFCIVAD